MGSITKMPLRLLLQVLKNIDIVNDIGLKKMNKIGVVGRGGFGKVKYIMILGLEDII